MLAALSTVKEEEDMAVVRKLFSQGNVNAKASQASYYNVITFSVFLCIKLPPQLSANCSSIHHFLPLLWRDAKAFPNMPGGVISSASLGSAPSPLSLWGILNRCQGTSSASCGCSGAPHPVPKAEPSRPSGGRQFQLFKLVISFFQSPLTAHDHRWRLERRSPVNWKICLRAQDDRLLPLCHVKNQSWGSGLMPSSLLKTPVLKHAVPSTQI